MLALSLIALVTVYNRGMSFCIGMRQIHQLQHSNHTCKSQLQFGAQRDLCHRDNARMGLDPRHPRCHSVYQPGP